MNKQSENMISREDFFAWLREGTKPLQFLGKTERCITFLKVPREENVIYLFSAALYEETQIRGDMTFHFCGMYFPKAQILRFAQYNLTWSVDAIEAEEVQRAEFWCERINRSVNEKIGQMIMNGQNNLSIRSLSDPENIQKMREFEEWGAEKEAEDIFLKGEMPDTEYHPFFRLQNFSKVCKEDMFIAYFQDAEKFLEEEAQKYIQTHEENILLTFLKNEILREKFEVLEQDLGSDVFNQRKITVAIRAAEARTVWITVEKDGREMTFRAIAKGIAHGRGQYSQRNIVSGDDRQKFGELFGRNTDFSVQDITRITHGRSVLYETPRDQTEEMDYGMTMA